MMRQVEASDVEWRLFAAVVGVGRRLAPERTTRRRMLDGVLKRVADGLDWAYVRVTPWQVIDVPAPPGVPAIESPADGPRGTINGPAPGSTARTMSLLWGWAVDSRSHAGTGVTAVRVYLDGYWKGTATYGLARRDVADQFGEQFTHCGWEFALDLQNASPGSHTVQIEAHSSVSGQETTYSLPIVVEAPPAATGGMKFALFISGAPGDPKRYRCDHQAEQLQLVGLKSDARVYGEVSLGQMLDQYHVFVLHRVLLSQDIAWFMDEAQRRGRVLLYDTDDLIFDVDATGYIDAFHRMGDRERESFLDCIRRGRQALLRCDAVLVSTEPLGEMVSQIHPRVVISPNVVDRSMVQEAQAALQHHTPRAPEAVTIGYLSGSPTHDGDFQQVTEALVWALETYPVAQLMTVGPLTLDPRFGRFAERVKQLPLRPSSQLAELVADIDVNLAPLEPDNPFTQSKSCIKYFESALLGVPTIASATPDFERAIEHGVTGFLARDGSEWRTALAELIESAELRQQIGERARQDTLRWYTTATAGSRLVGTLRELISVSAEDEPLTINWFVRAPCDLDSPAIRLAGYLAKRGHHVRLCITTRTGASDKDVVDLTESVQTVARSTTVESLVNCQPPLADVDVATDPVTSRFVESQGPSAARASLTPSEDDAEFEARLIHTAIAPRVPRHSP